MEGRADPVEQIEEYKGEEEPAGALDGFNPGNCPKHQRPLEVVDLTDKVLVCPKCALFGGYRGHAFKELSDVIDDVFDRAEKYTEIFNGF
jgi:hypothetical protein